MRRRSLARPASVLGALLGLAAAARPAGADDAADLQGLLNQTVVTTASKSAETGTVAPATSTTLTAEDIRRYGIRTLAEALDFLSLGMWTSSSLITTDVGARGVMLPSDQGSHTLLLIDGHVVNEPLFGTARFDRGAGVPIEIIDHIEVILGPGSVLYGTDAMNAVINVITKRAKDFSGVHVVADTEIGASERAAAGAGYQLTLFGLPSEVTAMAEYYTQSGPSLTFPTIRSGVDASSNHVFQYEPNGPYNGKWGGLANQANAAQVPSGLVRFVSGNLEVEVTGKIDKRVAPYDNIDFDQNAFFDDPGQYQVDRQASIDAKYRTTWSTLLQTTARLYGDTYDYQHYADTSWGAACLPYGSDTCRQYVLGVSRWAGTELQASFDWLKDASFVTLVGADGRLRYVASKTDLLDYYTGQNIRSSEGAFNHADETLGAYAQQTWRPNQWFGLNAGARLDLDPRFPVQISPRLAATAQAWRDGTFKAVYSEAFRAPSFGETSYSSQDEIVASGLRPETMRSAEASFEQRFGAHRLVFGVFGSWWRDLIELETLDPNQVAQAIRDGQLPITDRNVATQYRNVSSIDALGFNAGLEGGNAGGSLRYALNVTGVRAVDTSGSVTNPQPASPNIYGNARASYDIPGLWPTLALAARWLATRPADGAFANDYTPLPYAPAELDLRATVTGDVPLVRGLTYRMSADWGSSSVAPYVVGPPSKVNPSCQSLNCALNPELLPVDTFRAMLGLQYDFAQ
jgi:outer membrane receptor for ferrienterochelin and colicins